MVHGIRYVQVNPGLIVGVITRYFPHLLELFWYRVANPALLWKAAFACQFDWRQPASFDLIRTLSSTPTIKPGVDCPVDTLPGNVITGDAILTLPNLVGIFPL